jgi:hypothetical protein
MEQRLAAAEGDPASCGQIVKVIYFNPVTKSGRGYPLEGRLSVSPLVPCLRVDAKLALERTSVSPHQGCHPRSVGGHTKTIAKGKGKRHVPAAFVCAHIHSFPAHARQHFLYSFGTPRAKPLMICFHYTIRRENLQEGP